MVKVKKTNEKKTDEQKTDLMALLLKKEKTIPSLQKGNKFKAKIVSISKKRVLFDVGAKAYAVLGRIEQKEIIPLLSYLKPGQEIEVTVVSPESKDGFPVVSLRSFLNDGRWEILKNKKEKEEEIEVLGGEYGKGGLYVDFLGIRGVIPKIQLTDQYIHQPEKLTGQKIKVKILEVDKEKNRLVVSQKAAKLKITQKELKKKFDAIEVNRKYQARVISVSDFGVFCEIDGVEGLIHISEISWEKVTNPADYVKVGEKIDVLVIEKNVKDLKLNLSLKRLTPDPWENFEKKYPKDKEIEGVVVRKEKYGYFVRLEPGIEGLIHSSKIKDKNEVQVGKKIKVYVERVNLKNRRLSLILPQKEIPVTYR